MFAHTKYVTIPAPFRAQSCTPKASLHPKRCNQFKFALVRVLVCTRISVHLSECKPAPIIFAPIRVQICTLQGAEVPPWLQTWISEVQTKTWKFAPQSSGGTRGGHGGANAPPVRGFAPPLAPPVRMGFFFFFFYFFFFFFTFFFFFLLMS